MTSTSKNIKQGQVAQGGLREERFDLHPLLWPSVHYPKQRRRDLPKAEMASCHFLLKTQRVSLNSPAGIQDLHGAPQPPTNTSLAILSYNFCSGNNIYTSPKCALLFTDSPYPTWSNRSLVQSQQLPYEVFQYFLLQY